MQPIDKTKNIVLNTCVDNAHARKKARNVLLKSDTEINEYLHSEPISKNNNLVLNEEYSIKTEKLTFKVDMDKININK